MPSFRLLIAAAVTNAAAISLPAPLPAQRPAGYVTCESEGRERHGCRILPDTEVRLERQLSTAPCRRGTDWEVSGDAVWVSNGCRARFALYSRSGPIPPPAPGAGAGVGGGAGQPAFGVGTTTRLRCESRDGRRRECRIPSDARVRLVEQLSSTPCRQGSNWGRGSGLIWVDEGCRAEFEVTRRGEDGARRTTRVTCESNEGERTTCPIPRNSRVELRRQLSNTRCRRGSSWGVARNYIWVDNGCRAEFEVRRD